MQPRHRGDKDNTPCLAMREVPRQSEQEDAGAVAAEASRLIEVIEAARPMPAHLTGAVIALGNFDGFHLGHQKVVGRAVEMARARGVAAIVATFDPHPVDYFKPDAAPFRLSTIGQRRRLLALAGADAMMIFRFDGALAAVTPEVFVQNWLGTAGGVVTGENFTFGFGRSGNIRTLAALAAKQAMVAAAVAPVTHGGEIISSTRIRDALRLGDCETAARLLGRPFTVEGTLDARFKPRAGAGAGFARLHLGTYLQPASGLYAVQVIGMGGVAQAGVAQIGGPNTIADQQNSVDVYFAGPWPANSDMSVELTFLEKIDRRS